MAEDELYGPIKQFLEAQGYAVKGEIGPCDIVAVRGDEGPVVVELKESLTLTLILQAVDRLSVVRYGVHSLPHRKGSQRFMAFPEEAGDKPPPTPRPGPPHGLDEAARRARSGSRAVSAKTKFPPSRAAAKGVFRAGRRSGDRGLGLPPTTHRVPPGRSPVCKGTGRRGRPQGQRPPGAHWSVARWTHIARQPLRVVR